MKGATTQPLDLGPGSGDGEIDMAGSTAADWRVADLTAELRAHWLAWQTFADQCRARIMETAWQLREACGSEEAFAAHCSAHLDWLSPERRRELPAMVRTWAVARESRALREAAATSPSQAMALVSASIDAGLDLRDETDEEIIRLLTASAPRRRKLLRGLIEESAAARADGEADGESGGGEEADGDPFGHLLPSPSIAEAERALRRSALPALRDAACALARAEPLAERQRERMVALLDEANGLIDRIERLCMRDGSEGGGE